MVLITIIIIPSKSLPDIEAWYSTYASTLIFMSLSLSVSLSLSLSLSPSFSLSLSVSLSLHSLLLEAPLCLCFRSSL